MDKYMPSGQALEWLSWVGTDEEGMFWQKLRIS